MVGSINKISHGWSNKWDFQNLLFIGVLFIGGCCNIFCNLEGDGIILQALGEVLLLMGSSFITFLGVLFLLIATPLQLAGANAARDLWENCQFGVH